MELRRRVYFWAMLLALAAIFVPANLRAGDADAQPDSFGSRGRSPSRWKTGPPSDPNFFPIAVWLQSPKNAARYKAAGINVYVGLWRGPTSEQLDTLKQAGMRLVCSQSAAALSNINNSLIIGWMHGDEP